MNKQIKINGKWSIKLPESSANEWIGNMKYHNNTWEMKRLEALRKLIKPGSVVLYVGAYKGDMAALLASWGAELILVESSPGFWPIIKETWEINNLPKPLGMFSGLASNVTTSDITIEELQDWPTRTEEYIEGTTGFTHLAESGGHFPELTLDDLCARLGVIPDIITIDIEGSELLAMQGAINILTNHDAKYMMSLHPEFGFHNHGYYMRELFDLFGDNGYAWDYIDFDHEFHYLYQRKSK